MKSDRAETEYILSSKELAILLSAAGCDGLYGFSLAGTQNMDKGALLRELHSLFQKCFLRRKEGDDKLEIDPKLLPLLYACAKSRRVLRVSVLYPEQAPFAACYRGADGWVVMRPCEQRPDGWLLKWEDTAGILAFLEDYGLLPHPDDDLQRVQEKLPGYTDGESGGETPLVRLEWRDGKAGEQLDTVTISRGILTDWINTTAGRQPYMAERLSEWIEAGYKASEVDEREEEG